MQKKLADYPTTPNFDHDSWSFTVGSAFFGFDPNPNIPKMAVVTYRYMMPGPNSWSTHQIAAIGDWQTMTIRCPETLTSFHWPDPGPANQCVLAAFWYNKDVTAQVQGRFAASMNSPDFADGTIFPITVNFLGPDPSPGVPKQLTILYASCIYNKWYYRTLVQLQAGDGYVR